MSDHLIVRLALEWLKAERIARGENPELVSKADPEFAQASDRVYMVLSGDVRWSDAGPGDKHIWRGRFRDVEKFDRWWRNSVVEHMGKPEEVIDNPNSQTTPRRARGETAASVRVSKHPKRHKDYANYYDTVTLSERPVIGSLSLTRESLTTNLFSHANVGNLRLTNTSVAGQTNGDTTFYLDTMYAVPTNMGRFMTVCDAVFAQLTIGGCPRGPLVHVRELVMGIPVKTVIPQRQTFGVSVEHRVPTSLQIPAFELSVHLEGVVVYDR